MTNMRSKNDKLIIGINLGDYGSTGSMMLNSLEYAHNHGDFDTIALIPYETKKTNQVRTLSFAAKITFLKRAYYKVLRKLKFPIINDGNYYNEFTKNLINLIKNESNGYKKTIIHMHNMHMCNLNVNKFYKWLVKNPEYKVFYTLHDCWTFTGGCYYYSHIKCTKWMSDCKKCPQNIKYTKLQLKKRTKFLNKIKDLTLITVSKWAKDQVNMSKLRRLPTVVNLGETSLQPIITKPKLKNKMGLSNKKVVLLVGAYWNEWKGVKYIYAISKLLPERYHIIIVGPFKSEGFKNITQINNVELTELPNYYSMSDVYVSITQAEQLGLTTCEAQMCGCPIVGFGNGGSKETFIDGKSGIVVKNNDINGLISAIKYIAEKKPFKKEDIVASGNRFKKYEHSKRMLNIYKSLA